MKILLIAPPWLDIYGNFSAAAKLGCVSPPLGLMYLAGAILKAGSDCRIIDMESQKFNTDDLLNIVRDYKPELVGITSTTPVYGNARCLMQILRRHFPQIFIAMGGVHPTITRRQAMEECPELNFIACGEGEFLIQEVVSRLEQGKSLAGVAGVIYRDDQQRIIENPPRQLITELDEIPKPARELLNPDLFQHSLPGKGFVRYAGIFTSRGCPFQCVFCSQHTMYGRNVRLHSIERVIEEIQYIVNGLNIKHIIFMDETLTLNKARLLEICQEIKNHNIKFTWEGWTHVATVDKEILQQMKSAGLIRLSFGIESGDKEILDIIKKSITLDQVRNAYNIAWEVGIETRASAILGHPNETKKTAWRTIKFLHSIKECQQLFLNIACPYPGTELYEYAINGRMGMKLLSTDYSRYKRYGESVIEVNDLSARDLKRLQTIGLLYFYLTPRRIWYNIVKRAGLKAGIVNSFAFMQGIIKNSIMRNSKDKSLIRSDGDQWNEFWASRKKKPLGQTISWVRKHFITPRLVKYVTEHTLRGTLIEAGCGTAEVSIQTAIKRGDKLILVDLSKEILRQAEFNASQAGIRADIINCDINDLMDNIGHITNGCVFNVGVIEHFKDCTRALTQMAAVSGSSAFAVVPARSIFWRLFIAFSVLFKLVPEDFYIQLYAAKEIERIIANIGLCVIDISYLRIFGIIPYLGIRFSSPKEKKQKGKSHG